MRYDYIIKTKGGNKMEEDMKCTTCGEMYGCDCPCMIHCETCDKDIDFEKDTYNGSSGSVPGSMKCCKVCHDVVSFDEYDIGDMM